MQKYTEFILNANDKEKQRYISEKRSEFLQKYTRAKVQELVDARMAACNDEDSAYEYLVTPDIVLHRLYGSLVDVDSKDLVDNFTSDSIACYKEL